MGRPDPVTPDVRIAVFQRDQGCVAQKLGFVHECRTRMGLPHAWDTLGLMELDHVRTEPPIGTLAKTKNGGFGDRAPSDVEHLVTVCGFAHHSGWATSHRPELRLHIIRENDRMRRIEPAWPN